MDINLDPNVHLGPITLAWHGIFTAVGIFFGVALPIRLLRAKVGEDDAYAIATWGVVGGIIGARVVHVIDTWQAYAADPLRILAIWTGGIAIWGGVLGGVLGGLIVALRRRIAIGSTADGAAPGIGLGLAIGRIGDVINGEHHATACEPPAGICVTYSNPDTLGQGPTFAPGDARFSPDPVHLAVAYDMAWVLITVAIALLLWWRRERGLAPRLANGAIFWLWLFLYGVGRFTVSFLRVGDPQSLLDLRQDQLIGLATMIASIAMLVALTVRARATRVAAREPVGPTA